MAKAKVEIPGAVTEPEVVKAADVIVPTEAELAMLAALRSGKSVEQAMAPVPVHTPTAGLKDASEINQAELTAPVLTKQGWLLPEAAQKHANG